MTTDPPVRPGPLFSPVPRGAVLDGLDRSTLSRTTTDSRFSLARIEKLIATSIGIIGLVFGAQTLSIALGAGVKAPGVIGTAYMVAFLGILGIVILLWFNPRAQRIANTVFAIVYLVGVALWPLATGGSTAGDADEPWTWYLCAIACASASQAFRPAIAVAYILVTPAIYGVTGVLDESWRIVRADIALQNALYGSMIGLVIFALLMTFRHAAKLVDTARIAAFARYDDAIRQHAREVERIEVDALIHDTVLASLQAADRARRPEEAALAVSMASDAIKRLATMDEPITDAAETASLRGLVSGLERYAAALDVPFDITLDSNTDLEIAYPVAQNLYLAATQAMANSAQHAGGADVSVPVHRSVTVTVCDGDGVELEVSDDGIGFDRQSIEPNRLGLRVSIIERVVAVGGTVDLDSAPGQGTRISIRWTPAEARAKEGARS
ncbi:signal transduction histidine kinase [Okibacterium sp. HSC-33S16]|uniref:sensor histidine kinase n=1 Tax=Okibacterium sp. HSC-33S16 TaxID=2910965 RepID=UPI0020A1D498|nr:ATP-binding protein [Okibacterium sp. HSC-33S16]MCP2031650.1 signal transduction histidine kinase [Okibacterium sp. HSC-33S16]